MNKHKPKCSDCHSEEVLFTSMKGFTCWWECVACGNKFPTQKVDDKRAIRNERERK